MSRQWTSECNCLLLANFISEDQRQRGAEQQDLENLWHGQERSLYFCCIQGRYSQQINEKHPRAPGLYRRLRSVEMQMQFRDFFQGRFPHPHPKEPGVLCMPRTVLGFRPTSFCSASEMSQGYHKHGSLLPVGSSTPHNHFYHTGSADMLRARVVIL